VGKSKAKPVERTQKNSNNGGAALAKRAQREVAFEDFLREKKDNKRDRVCLNS